MDKITIILVLLAAVVLFINWVLNQMEREYPLYIHNVWYNFHAYSRENYPIIFDKDGKYIPCQEGNKVIGFKTKNGKNVYYTIKNIEYKSASDYLYDSDGYHCDLKFSHVEE